MANRFKNNIDDISAEQVLHLMNDLVFILNSKGVFTQFLSPQHQGRLIYPPEMFIGKKYTELNLPKELIEHTKKAFHLAKSRSPIPDIDYLLPVNGEDRWYVASYSPYYENGKLVKMLAIIRDITIRKQMENEVRASELRFENLIDNLNGIVYRFKEPDGKNILFLGNACEEITGYQSSDFITGKRTWRQLILPEYQDQYLAQWQEALNQKSSIDTEYEIKTANGEFRWIHDRGRGIFDSNGKLISVEGYAYDSTHRKLAQKRIVQSESDLKTILESTGTMMAIIDKNGDIVFANNSFRKSVGYSITELIGKKWYEFVPKEDKGWLSELALARAKGAKGIPNQYNQKLIHKNGSIINVFTTVNLLPGTRKQIISMADLSLLDEVQQESKIYEERFEKFINSATEGFTLLDQNLNYVMINDTALSIFPAEYTRESIIGKNVKDVIPGIEKTGRLEAYKSVIKTGKPITINQLDLGSFFRNTHVSLKVFKVGNGIGQVFEDITKRVIAEEKIKVKNQQYYTLISNLEGMAYRCINDHDWTMEFVSDGVLKLTGYQAADLIGNKNIAFNDLILEEYQEFLWDLWQTKLKQKERVVVEYRIKRADGAIRWVHERGLGIFDNDGNLTHLEGYIVDITDQKETQEILRRSEKQFRNILENMSEGYFELDMKGNLTFFNDSFIALVGNPNNLKTGIKFTHFLDAKNTKLWNKTLKDVSRTSRNAIQEYTLLSSGHKCEISMSKRLDDSNNMNGYKGIVIDISEKERSEKLQNAIYMISEATHQSKTMKGLYRRIHNELQKVVESYNLYIAYYDEEKRLISFPYYKDETDEYPSSARPLGKGLTEYVIRTGKPQLLTNNDILELAKTDEVNVIGTLPEQWIASPLISGKKTVGVIAMQSYKQKDLYNQADLDILNYISDQIAIAMERKIVETQLKTSERKHRKLSEELEESNSFKELLIDIVGHDLKTPAGVIQGFSSLLYEEDPNNEFIGHIYESSKNLVNTFNDLTVLNKTYGTEKLPMETLSLSKLIETAVNDYKFHLHEKNMTITNLIKKDISFKGNHVIIEVFKNYINNAIKYASHGKKIKLHTKKNGKKTIVMVSDYGTTIDTDKREKIFQRSIQLSKSSVGGIGLGLAIVSRIAHLHGFKVWVEENHPNGNSFCIEIK